MPPTLPTGAATFVFTDIEGSTALLARIGDEPFGELLAVHHGLVRESIAAHDGLEISTEGDAFFAVFAHARDAISMVIALQLALADHPWPKGCEIQVRIGIHSGVARLGGDNYIGLDVNEAARIRSAAHGGQVLASAATVDAVADMPPGATWRSLGPHRLKDLGSPIELFQLCHVDLADDFRALNSIERVAHNLPVQSSSFLGREAELAQGVAHLKSARLVTLTGPGGNGKTRVAFQLSAQMLEEFPDGIWVADLGAISDPVLVAATLKIAIGLPDQAKRDATEALVAHFRDRRALVILDNCEHVIEAAAALASALLNGCADLRIVATSREALRVAGELVWMLGPMRIATAGQGDGDVSGASGDAVRLFCERALLAGADFAVTPENLAIITAICVRLEGIPLAIELAAVRTRTLPLTQILSRLETSFDLLSKGARGSVSRHGSLRAAIDWSHDQLSTAERTMLRRLSVFAGGCTLEAAEGVCSDGELDRDDVLDLLDSLVDKSLVSLVQTPAGHGRFRLLETIRSYAAEKLLDSGEETEVLDRHTEFFSLLAGRFAETNSDTELLRQLEADQANLLAVLDRLALGTDPTAHSRLMAHVAAAWEVQGLWRLARRELLKYFARSDRNDADDAECFFHLGQVTRRLGDLPEASRLFNQGLRLARATSNRKVEGRCLGDLGHVAIQRGNYDDAKGFLTEALAIAEAVDDQPAACRWLGNLGILAETLGDYVETLVLYERALELARTIGDPRQETVWLGNLGGLQINLGRYREAAMLLEQALQISHRLGHRATEEFHLGNLGEIARKVGDLPLATIRYSESLAIAREIGDRRGESFWLGSLGNVAMHQGELSTARDLVGQAMEIAQSIAVRGQECEWHWSHGEIDLYEGDFASAAVRFADAMEMARDLGEQPMQARILASMGMLALYQGELSDAEQRLDNARGMARSTGEISLAYHCLIGLGIVATQRFEHRDATNRFLQALTSGRQLGEPDSALLDGCGLLLLQLDRPSDAAYLLVAAGSLREQLGVVRPTAEQLTYGAAVATCRTQLSDDQWEEVSALGAHLDWDLAVNAATELIDRAGDVVDR